MDWICHTGETGHHQSHCPSLDTRGKAQAGPAVEQLASNSRGGAEDHSSHAGGHSEAGPEQAELALICCFPTRQDGLWA